MLALLALFSIRLLDTGGDSDDSAESQQPIEGTPTSDSEHRTVPFENVESLPVVKNDEQLSPSGDQNGGSDDGGVLEPEAGGEEYSGQHVQVYNIRCQSRRSVNISFGSRSADLQSAIRIRISVFLSDFIFAVLFVQGQPFLSLHTPIYYNFYFVLFRKLKFLSSVLFLGHPR